MSAGGHPPNIGPADTGGAAGGPARHRPVLLEEAIGHLGPSAGGLFIDATFGAGGYSRAILKAGGSVLAIDRDPTAIAAGRALEAASGGRLKLVEGRFSDLAEFARAFGFAPADGVVMDVGVSSLQLDDPGRGFSFRADGPLDMRMGGDGADAAAIVNRASVKELAAIIGTLGEERKAGRIARAIDRARAEAPIAGTARLAAIVADAVGGGPSRIHPATRTFQALRIFVNRELDELARGLSAAEEVLRAGGRLVVVAFHSLEDRIVKRFLQDRSRPARGSRHAPEAAAAPPSFRLLTRGAIEPSEAEIAANPRARSARLRAAERTAAPMLALDMAQVGVPRLRGAPGPEAFA